MNVNLTGKEHDFRQKKSRTNPYRTLVLLILVVISVFVLRAVETGAVKSPFEATPTATRISNSFALEGETHFIAGDLNKAIASYRSATILDPKNARLWADLARIQAYSSSLLTTDDERRVRLKEALESINKAVKIAPEDSTVHAIRVLVLDWNANTVLAGDQSQSLLTEAEQEAGRALQLDNQNTLALAYYAEVLVDQQKWVQAEEYINQAMQRDKSLMDVHRVMAYVQESLGNYNTAIEEYKAAAEITPNLTFLYLSIGYTYRVLALKAQDNKQLFETALEYFQKAVRINAQLQIKDPIPYLALGRTYMQMGEFFSAALNVRKALEFEPENPDVYGTLGLVFFRSRNYESAIPALNCAVYGCPPAESCDVRQCNSKTDPALEIKGLPLSPNTVVYYYTYVSVLAGMHRPGTDLCQQALKVMAEVRAGFSGDSDIMTIIKGSENLCASFGINP
jgi:tetratricopeptide (TPR) repeat protein